MDREVEIPPKSTEREPESQETEGPGKGGDRIRCPFCGWSPGARDLWMCSCNHMWNTFDTGGVCPKCLVQWLNTQCHRCHQWSPHSVWYPAD